MPEPRADHIALPSSGQITVQHLAAPPTFIKPKRIHPRRLLPVIKKGVEREIRSRTPALLLSRPSRLDAGQDLVISTNTPLTSPGRNSTASNVGEPSTSVNGQVVLYTGNWYAAISTDASQTFQFIAQPPLSSSLIPQGPAFVAIRSLTILPRSIPYVWLLQFISPQDFAPLDGYMVPRQALPFAPLSLPANLPLSFTTRPEGQESAMPTFRTAIKSTQCV